MKKTVMIIALISFVLFDVKTASALAAITANNPSSCEASALLGLLGSCSVSCGQGQCAQCKSGIFSCSCQCVACQDVGTVAGNRAIPSLTEGLRQDAINFAEWCTRQSSSIQQLNPIVIGTINAIDVNDIVRYNYFEDLFSDTFFSMSKADQDLCNAWATGQGYN